MNSIYIWETSLITNWNEGLLFSKQKSNFSVYGVSKHDNDVRAPQIDVISNKTKVRTIKNYRL